MEHLFKHSQVTWTPSSSPWRPPSPLTRSSSSPAPATAESTSGTARTARRCVSSTETTRGQCSVFSLTPSTWWWRQRAAPCHSGCPPSRMKFRTKTNSLTKSGTKSSVWCHSVTVISRDYYKSFFHCFEPKLYLTAKYLVFTLKYSDYSPCSMGVNSKRAKIFQNEKFSHLLRSILNIL